MSGFSGNQVSVVTHCDWSTRPEKRWMVVGLRKGRQWELALPEPVGNTSTLVSRLQKDAGPSGRTLIGFDFPIGLPSPYGKLTGFDNFRHALRELGTGVWARWYDVAEHRSEISIHRPFYPMRAGGTLRVHLFEGLGVADRTALLRLCERATDHRSEACMLFWTLGGNQVGKAAIAGWREVIVPNLATVGLWPFDGTFAEVLRRFPVTIVETYPADVYRQIGIPRYPRWSKRLKEGRRSVSKPLLRWMETRDVVLSPPLISVIEEGFSTKAEGEDQFDALVGAMGMLDVVDGHRGDGATTQSDVTSWEGWIFGQA